MDYADRYQAKGTFESVQEVEDFLQELGDDLLERAENHDHVGVGIEVKSTNFPSFMAPMTSSEGHEDSTEELDENDHQIDID